ncbi:MAG: hypothetical protein EA424_02505 [Planctomycetaceae bacterium]|nr:MAG: hypothetical protein EA424_02505 [Planctomycetaceae bacterium]
MVDAMAKKRQVPGVRPEFALVEFYRRNGYMRVPNETLREDAPREYKKGYEIRLIARSQRELMAMRRLIRQVDLRPGKPFSKHNQWVQPIYGRDAMDLFIIWLDEFGEERDGKPARNRGKKMNGVKLTTVTKSVSRNNNRKKTAPTASRTKKAASVTPTKKAATVKVAKSKNAISTRGTSKKAATATKRRTGTRSAPGTQRASRKAG